MTRANATRRWFLTILTGASLLLGGCIAPGPGDDGTNSDGNTPGDEVTPAPTNHAPIAAAGDDQTVAPAQDVTLSGTASSDADSDRISYVWRQVGSGPSVELTGAFSAIARFTAPGSVSSATTLTFSLTVTDGFAASVDQIQVLIQP